MVETVAVTAEIVAAAEVTNSVVVPPEVVAGQGVHPIPQGRILRMKTITGETGLNRKQKGRY
jgi:hypothetical protein